MLYYSIAGTDFTSVTRTVIFNVGVVSARVEVTILDDTAIENTETFTASLTTTEGNVVITNAIATVSILDDFDGELSTYLLLLALPLLVKTIAYNKLPRAIIITATLKTVIHLEDVSFTNFILLTSEDISIVSSLLLWCTIGL